MRRFLKAWGALLILGLSNLASRSANPPIRIWPLGDSLTYGYSPDTPVEGGYRTQLYQLLTAAGYTVDFVGTLADAFPPPQLGDPDHDGHGGYRIDGLSSGVDEWLGEIDDPDVILLLIGTNDYWQNDDTLHAINRLENLITHLATTRPYARILVSNLPWFKAMPTIDNAIQASFNPNIPGVVAHQVSLGRQVYFVDGRSCCGASELSSDNVHPNLSGYQNLAQKWYDTITSVIGPQGGAADRPALSEVRALVDLKHVLITFSKPIADAAASVSNFGLDNGVLVLQATLDSSKRVITLTTTPQAVNTVYTLVINGIRDRTAQQNLIAPGTTVNFTSGPIAEAGKYQLVYSLRLAGQPDYNSGGAPYDIDDHANVGSFQRVAYYLELQPAGGSLQYVWVSMDAFTTDSSKIGVPTIQSGGFFQNAVANMNVRSSVPGVVTGDGLTGGNIEFWWGNYSPSNAAGVPGASSTLYDFGDAASASDPAGYGSMQVHNHAAGQTIFAFNDFSGAEVCDLGIGNYSGANPDWTFARNGTNYLSKLLQVYVSSGRTLVVNSANPSTGITVRIAPNDDNGVASGLTSFTRSYANGTIVSLSAAVMTGPNTFYKWQRDGLDFSNSPRVSVTMDGDHTLTASYVPTRTLTVTSVNPNTGVNIRVSPADNNHLGDGFPSFTRYYADGITVNLAAALKAGNNNFVKWQKNGVDFSTASRVSLTLHNDQTLTAVYGP